MYLQPRPDYPHDGAAPDDDPQFAAPSFHADEPVEETEINARAAHQRAIEFSCS